MTDLVKIARGFTLVDDKRTHYPGCERDHISCLVQSMANELERRDEWRDGVLDKITTVGYILGQHDGEALVNTAKRVTDEIERLRAEIRSAKPDPCKDGSCDCCWVDKPSEIERLRSDAERYRWLRENINYIDGIESSGELSVRVRSWHHDCDDFNNDTIDAHIDAAIAKWSERE